MKKIRGLILAFCLRLTGTAFAQNVAVLFAGDVHCGIEQGIGYVVLAAIRDKPKADGNCAMFIDNGESIRGDPPISAIGRIAAAAMNAGSS